MDNCSIYNITCKVLGVKRYGGVTGGGRNPAFLDQILIISRVFQKQHDKQPFVGSNSNTSDLTHKYRKALELIPGLQSLLRHKLCTWNCNRKCSCSKSFLMLDLFLLRDRPGQGQASFWRQRASVRANPQTFILPLPHPHRLMSEGSGFERVNTAHTQCRTA